MLNFFRSTDRLSISDTKFVHEPLFRFFSKPVYTLARLRTDVLHERVGLVSRANSGCSPWLVTWLASDSKSGWLRFAVQCVPDERCVCQLIKARSTVRLHSYGTESRVPRTCVRNRRWTAGRCAQLWGDVLKLHVCLCEYTLSLFFCALTMTHGRVRLWRRVSCKRNERIVLPFVA